MSAKKLSIVILLSILLSFSIVAAIKIYADLRLGLTSVYVASHNIGHRSEISIEDVKEILVPKDYLSKDIYLEKDDILNKYVKVNHSIPKGSFFYKSSLEASDTMNDYAHTVLEKGQSTYDLNIKDINVNPAHLKTGMRINLYLTLDEDKPISDILLKNALITGMYDHKYQMINELSDEGDIEIISIAVNTGDIIYLNKALLLGKISLVVSDDTYEENLTCCIIKDSLVFPFLD